MLECWDERNKKVVHESTRIKEGNFLLLIAEEICFTACGNDWNE